MRIRFAGTSDAAAIAEIHVQSWHETYQGLIPQRVIDARTVIEERLSDWESRLHEANPGRTVFVAEESGSVRGFIWIAPSNESVWKRIPGFDEHVYALYVKSNDHRRGVGRELMRASADALLSRGRRSLSLDVLSANPARAFYERLGARLISTMTIRDGEECWEQCAYGWTDISPYSPDEMPKIHLNPDSPDGFGKKIS